MMKLPKNVVKVMLVKKSIEGELKALFPKKADPLKEYAEMVGAREVVLVDDGDMAGWTTDKGEPADMMFVKAEDWDNPFWRAKFKVGPEPDWRPKKTWLN